MRTRNDKGQAVFECDGCRGEWPSPKIPPSLFERDDGREACSEICCELIDERLALTKQDLETSEQDTETN